MHGGGQGGGQAIAGPLERAAPDATHGGGQAITAGLEPAVLEATQGGGQEITAGLEPAVDPRQHTHGDGHTG